MSHMFTGSGLFPALLRVFSSPVITPFGYASFAEYVERLFGYKPRLTVDKLRVALPLESLPELNRALRDGELTWSATCELTCVAGHPGAPRASGRSDAEQDRAPAGTVGFLAEELGARPGAPVRPEARRHVLPSGGSPSPPPRVAVRASSRSTMIRSCF